MKLDGISYHDNELRVDDATSTRKRPSNNTLNESRRPSVVVNYYLEKQHSYGRKCSPSESKFSKRKKQIAIFGGSIPRGIRLHESSYWLHKGYAQSKSLPGGATEQTFAPSFLSFLESDFALL